MTKVAMLNAVRSGVLALALGASLAAGSFGFIGHAEAGGPKDGVTVVCAHSQVETTRIKDQLAPVELDIKELMQQMEQKRNEEDQVKDDKARMTESNGSSKNLDKAADSYQQMRDATSLLN